MNTEISKELQRALTIANYKIDDLLLDDNLMSIIPDLVGQPAFNEWLDEKTNPYNYLNNEMKAEYSEHEQQLNLANVEFVAESLPV
ncbi:hypothetical protein BCT19_01285 [Vibrio splendidus]|uniref:hypothetical protein n=1 Tax=Vibrio splendidus TaxID=29497 RepID=UPI000C848588|nr:hypothetical protein [Vibrio splendidus]PMO04345.1 hypothetical protein BCT19_01285 [Vibrio splendidus]